MFEFINSYLESETSAIIIANIITATLIGVVGFIFRNTLARYIRKLFPRLHSKTPHINFELKEPEKKNKQYKRDITISNAGDEPIYNVYAFFYECHIDIKNSYKIRSLGHEGVKRGVLGVRDEIVFKDLGEYFETCNVTSRQEVWVEYENSVGLAFRTIITPNTADGFSPRTRPPFVIKRRLQQIPGLVIEGGDRNWKKYEKGKKAPYTI